MFCFGEMFEKRAEISRNPRLGRMTPFRMIGNTYFVGTYQASCHLIDTGEGLIMIDPGYANTAELVMESVRELGFRPEEIRYIINTHWHDDHTAATASFASVSGAKTVIGRDDAVRAMQFFTPDILLDDGDVLSCGNYSIRFLHTPGHTKGTVSLFYEETENGNLYRVGMFGGAGVNTLIPAGFEFDGCREAYFASLDRLKSIPVDVVLGNHTWNNGTYEKSQKLLLTGVNDFIDSDLWVCFLNACRGRLNEIIRRERIG